MSLNLDTLKTFSKTVLNMQPDNSATGGSESNAHTQTMTNDNHHHGEPGMVRIDIPAEPQQQQPSVAQLVTKNLVVVLAAVAVVMGILNAMTLSVWCLLGGVLLALTGVVILGFEAPLLLSSYSFADPIRQFSVDRKPFEKVIIYTVPALIVIILCPTLFTLIGSLAVASVSALYVLAYFV